MTFHQVQTHQPNEWLYVLELEEGKYYVGKTHDLERRLSQHFSGTGSAWTTKYHPIRMIETVPTETNPFAEDTLTKKTMLKYGVDNVRGGSYATIVLPDEQVRMINRELFHSQDACLKCGKIGHFIRDCGNDKKRCVKKRVTRQMPYHPRKESQEQKRPCYRCGRLGHCESNCYAKTTKDCIQLMSSEDEESEEEDHCRRCGRCGHRASECYAKTIKDSRHLTSSEDEESDDEEDRCRRCGRCGHRASECYAKTIKDGRHLTSDEDEESNEEEDCCRRCGRCGHRWSECYAKTDIRGYPC